MTTRSREIPAFLTQAENLPSLPAVAIDILRLSRSDDVELADMANAISRDPALAGKMLKLANSAMFSTGSHQITTLQRAVMQLGMKTVKLMSLSFSLVSTVPTKSSGGFDIDKYWEYSLIGAVSARNLMERSGSLQTDEAFLCGLLGHIGKLVLSQCMPVEFTEVASNEGGWPSHAKEIESLGFSSADVAAALLEAWELPSIIVQPVSHMFEPSGMPVDLSEDSKRLVQIMHIAQLATDVQCGSRRGEALAAFQAATAEQLEWDEEQCTQFFLELEEGIAEGAKLMDMKLEGRQSPAEILAEARNQMIHVSLGTAADLNVANRRAQELASRADELHRQATTDALTGLPNRAAVNAFLKEQLEARLNGRVPRALGVVMVDVDKFKVFNDTHGHQAGDAVLEMVGRVFARETRRVDLGARYGGEEFIVVCPQSNPFGLKTLAERLRTAIESEAVEFEGKTLKVTASFGAACVSTIEGMTDGQKLIKLADHYLYKAKENGRNRCEVYPKMKFPGAR